MAPPIAPRHLPAIAGPWAGRCWEVSTHWIAKAVKHFPHTGAVHWRATVARKIAGRCDRQLKCLPQRARLARWAARRECKLLR